MPSDDMRKGKILIACEESQAVCKAFRALGYEAYSCDMLPESGGHPEWHIQGNVLPILKQDWDMLIAFPPCTHLAVSGAAWFHRKKKEQEEALGFVRTLMEQEHIPHIAIENPIGVISTRIRKPDQIIHPWQFGHPEQKSTCLWLKGIPKLMETNNVKEEMMRLPKNKRERLHYLPPSKDRALIRSKTFQGIADAMAAQWSKILI